MESEVNTEEINMIRHNLTDFSYMDIGMLPDYISDYCFDTLWNIHPHDYGEIKIYGKVIKTPRWQQAYGRSYNFSGMNHVALDLPKEFQLFLDFVNSLDYGQFNQILINWYENGLHSIGKHSDDERSLVPGSPIISISLGETRTFRLRKKCTDGIFKDIELTDRMLVVMGDDFQKEFTHEIPKVTGKKGEELGRLISITFRQFKN